MHFGLFRLILTPISAKVFSLPTFAIVRQQVTRNGQWGLIRRRQRGKACLPAQAGILAMNLATPTLARLLRRKSLFSNGFSILAGFLTGDETP